MSDLSFLFGIIVYVFVAYLSISIVNKYLKSSWWAIRYYIQAIVYSLFFGLGAVGGGGDPGFALPAPTIVAAWYATSNKEVLNNAVFPFLFWWCLIFLILLIPRIYRHLKKILLHID